MPTEYDINPKRCFVISRLSGAVPEAEVFDHNTRLRSDPNFNPSHRQFVDMTGITEIKVGTQMINETSLDQFFLPGTRRAFMATDDGVFGIARMPCGLTNVAADERACY